MPQKELDHPSEQAETMTKEHDSTQTPLGNETDLTTDDVSAVDSDSDRSVASLVHSKDNNNIAGDGQWPTCVRFV